MGNKSRYVVLLFLLGLLIALQVRSAQTAMSYVPLSDIQEIQAQLDREKAELDQLQQEVALVQDQITAFDQAKGDAGDLRDLLKTNLQEAQKVAGVTDMEGPGVIVIINDGDRELLEHENPNTVIVHNMDVQALVDDLRLAGAEAIAVNGQRVIFGHTEIQCTGPTIRVNDEVYAQPFVIKAIGNRRHLESALNAPGTYGQVLKQYGVFVEVYTSINIVVPAFEGSLQPLYSKPVEEESQK